MGNSSSRQRLSQLTFKRYFKPDNGQYCSLGFTLDVTDVRVVKYTEQAWDNVDEATEVSVHLTEKDALQIWDWLSRDCLALLKQLSESRTGMGLDPTKAVSYADIDTVRATLDGAHHEVSYAMRAPTTDVPQARLGCTTTSTFPRGTSNPGGSPAPVQHVMTNILGVVQEAFATSLAREAILEKLEKLEKKAGEYGHLPPEQVEELQRLRQSMIRWLQDSSMAVSKQELALNWARVIKVEWLRTAFTSCVL